VFILLPHWVVFSHVLPGEIPVGCMMFGLVLLVPLAKCLFFCIIFAVDIYGKFGGSPLTGVYGELLFFSSVFLRPEIDKYS
jgi:hypothetical protein